MSGSVLQSVASLAIVAAATAAATACSIVWNEDFQESEKVPRVREEKASPSCNRLRLYKENSAPDTVLDGLPVFKKLEWLDFLIFRSMFSLFTWCGGSKMRIPISLLPRNQTIKQLESSDDYNTLDFRFKVNWSKPLGEGSYGVVYPGIDQRNGEQVAIKRISKHCTDKITIQQEIDALKHLQAAGGHPNICGLHESFEEDTHYYLVLDLVSGGELYERCKTGAYSEADAARLVRQITSALAFMHANGIVHADLKPENLMFSSSNPNEAAMQVVDFGSAQVKVESPDDCRSRACTAAYSPPEVLSQKQKSARVDPSFDMWSLGIILYIMLTGVHPFDLHGNATDTEIEEQVLSGTKPPLGQSSLTAHLSSDAIGLIEQLIQWDPTKRLTALQLLEHPWMESRLSTVSNLLSV